MNFYAIRALYKFEMARTFRTLLQSVVSPVLSTRSISSFSAGRSAHVSQRSMG